LIQNRQLHWSEKNEERERQFSQRRADQAQLLEDAKAERARQERISEELEATFNKNEATIGDLQDRLNERLGTLRELFGVLQQVADDARGVFQSSLVSAQIPGREEWLEDFARKMGESSQLATIAEMERLWALLQEQMTATGEITTYRGVVTSISGNQIQTPITRVGAFSLIADGKYLTYNTATGKVVELPRQPASRFVSGARRLAETEVNEIIPFAIDPTRGSLLNLLIQSKTLGERIQDGGGVGAVIIILGLIGIALAVFQWVYLSRVGSQIRKQTENLDSPNESNPLGRVLLVGTQSKDIGVETLELKLSEAVMAEIPKLTRFLPIVQVISVVSPLLGLLGTVVGMILTFQAITLFGTGDPQTMAGGISTALVTTVLGLCAAIPTVLLHALVNSRSRGLVHILEEQSTGLVAQQAEQAGRILD